MLHDSRRSLWVYHYEWRNYMPSFSIADAFIGSRNVAYFSNTIPWDHHGLIIRTYNRTYDRSAAGFDDVGRSLMASLIFAQRDLFTMIFPSGISFFRHRWTSKFARKIGEEVTGGPGPRYCREWPDFQLEAPILDDNFPRIIILRDSHRESTICCSQGIFNMLK